MKLLIDSFWRAGAYCLHPKVIGLSLLPLAVGAALSLGMAWFYWEPAVAGMRALLEQWLLVDAALKWVEGIAGASFRTVLAPMLVVVMAAPVVVVVSLLLVALLMLPAMVRLVAKRRFPALERKHGSGFFGSLFWSLGCTLLALLALLASLPLWLLPPLVLLLPPLIWGWLTYKMMSWDALAEHASPAERRQLLRDHRMPLLGMGVVSGYLGAAPSLLWAFSALTLVFAPFILAVSVWLYTLVFAFSALWFAHYLLSALAQQRAQAAVLATVQPMPPGRPATEVIDISPLPPTTTPPTNPPATPPGPSAGPALPPPLA